MSLLFGAGTGDLVDHGAAASFADLNPFTWALWVYPTTFTDGRKLLVKGNIRKFLELQGTSGHLRFFVDQATTNTQFITNSNPLTLNAWNFVGVVFDTGAGAGEVGQIYVGTLSALATEGTYSTATDGSGGVVSDHSPTPLPLVVGNNSGGNVAFQGRIAWAGVWNRALSLGELRAQQFSPRNTSGCVLFTHYGFNGTGSQADWSGAGNHGTVTGATAAAHVPLAAPFGAEGAWEPSGATVVNDQLAAEPMTASAQMLTAAAFGGSGLFSGGVMRASAAMPTAVLTTTAPGTINAGVMQATASMPQAIMRNAGTITAELMSATARMPAGTMGTATSIPFNAAVMAATAAMPAGAFAAGGKIIAGAMRAVARLLVGSLQADGAAPSAGTPGDVYLKAILHDATEIDYSALIIDDRLRLSAQIPGGDREAVWGLHDKETYDDTLAHPNAKIVAGDLAGNFWIGKLEDPGLNPWVGAAILNLTARGYAAHAHADPYTAPLTFAAGTSIETIFTTVRNAKAPLIGTQNDLIGFTGRFLEEETDDLIGMSAHDIWSRFARYGDAGGVPLLFSVHLPPAGGTTPYLELTPQPTAPTLFVDLADLDDADLHWPVPEIVNKVVVRYKSGDTTATVEANDTNSQANWSGANPTGIGETRTLYKDASGQIDNATDAQAYANALLADQHTLRAVGSTLVLKHPYAAQDEFGLDIPIWRVGEYAGRVLRVTSFAAGGSFLTNDHLVVGAEYDEGTLSTTLQLARLSVLLDLWGRLEEDILNDLADKIEDLQEQIDDLTPEEGEGFTVHRDEVPILDDEDKIPPEYISDTMRTFYLVQQVGSRHADADPIAEGEGGILPSPQGTLNAWELYCIPAGSITWVARAGWPGGAVIATGTVGGGQLASGDIAYDASEGERFDFEVTTVSDTQPVRFLVMVLRGERS